MTSRLIPCALALCASPICLAAADDPAATLKAAAEACRNVQNGRYHAVWQLQDANGQQKVEGDIAFMHWPPDVETPAPPPPKPNADGSVPAMATIKAKLRTNYNADFRIDLSDGRTLAFNHDAGVILDPSAKLYRAMKTTDGGESLITRDNAGALLSTPLLEPEMLEKFAASKALTAGPKQKVADVDCDVVTFHLPKPDAATDLSITVWIGVDDHLPRQMQHEQMTDGKSAMKQATTISDLQCNVRMNAAQFDVQAPDGFKVENVQREAPPQLLAEGAVAPGFALQNADGGTVTLAELKGKIVLIDFWGTWCGPCKMAMPSIQKVYAKYKDQGVMVIGISCREKPGADPVKTMAELGCDYGLLLNGETIVKDWHVPGYPTLYVIDREGKIAHAELGYDEQLEGKLSEALDALLKK